MSGDLSGFSLMELFRSEAESQVAILSEGLLALEGSAASLAAIEPMMRAAHSIKGAARIVGLDAVVRLAHALEDCFVAAQREKIRIESGHVDRLLRAVDLLSRISSIADDAFPAWIAENGGQIDATVEDLERMLSSEEVVGSADLPSPPSPPSSPPAQISEPEPGARRSSQRSRPWYRASMLHSPRPKRRERPPNRSNESCA